MYIIYNKNYVHTESIFFIIPFSYQINNFLGIHFHPKQIVCICKYTNEIKLISNNFIS